MLLAACAPAPSDAPPPAPGLPTAPAAAPGAPAQLPVDVESLMRLKASLEQISEIVSQVDTAAATAQEQAARIQKEVRYLEDFLATADPNSPLPFQDNLANITSILTSGTGQFSMQEEEQIQEEIRTIVSEVEAMAGGGGPFPVPGPGGPRPPGPGPGGPRPPGPGPGA